MQVRATLTLAVYEVEESSANTVTLLQSLTLVPPSFCLVAVAKDKEKSATGNCSPAEITTRAGSERKGCGVDARALNSESDQAMRHRAIRIRSGWRIAYAHHIIW